MTYAQVLELVMCICGIVLCKMSIHENANDNRKPVRYINNDHH